jgi:hypothetical protein
MKIDYTTARTLFLLSLYEKNTFETQARFRGKQVNEMKNKADKISRKIGSLKRANND